MAFVRYQRKWVQTLLGAIRPERAYYHCAECRQGHVPLDHQLGLGTDSLSGELEQALCLLVARMPLEETADTLQRLLKVQVDDNTVQRAALAGGVGDWLAQQGTARRNRHGRASKPPEMEVEKAPERLYISVDGTTAHLQEGWKEVKVAAIYETEALVQADGTDRHQSSTHHLRGLIRRCANLCPSRVPGSGSPWTRAGAGSGRLGRRSRMDLESYCSLL